jgi:vancomycin resistance protein VanJ
VQTFGRTMARVIVGAAVLYCGLMLSLGVLSLLPIAQPWWLSFLNVFKLFWYVPLIVLLPAALLIRSRVLRFVVALMLAVFLVQFGARLVPPEPQVASGKVLRVMTLNQLYSNGDIPGLIAAIRAQNADVVALQELSRPMADAIEQELLDEYPYQVLMPAERDNGQGLLSRYPLHAPQRDPDFPAQLMEVDVDGTVIQVMNVHLHAPRIKTRRLELLSNTPLRRLPLLVDYDTSVRDEEWPALLEGIDAIQGDLIVMGDFNTGDCEQPYAAMAARLRDAHAEAGWGFGFTFPRRSTYSEWHVPFPLVRIDYIWTKGALQPISSQVVCENGSSDHCAVVAEVRLEQPDSPVLGLK